MIKTCCDRCGKECANRIDYFEKSQNCEIGTFFIDIHKVIVNKYAEAENGAVAKDYDTIDLCDECQKELNEFAIKFMEKK